MSAMRQFIIITVVLVCWMFPNGLRAGASGIVSGFVRDKETGNPLPGAAVMVEHTTFGATADKYGFYIIYNLPAGEYNLRATMIGYVPTKVTHVEVKTDLNAPVNFSLTAQVLDVEQEIIVTAPRIKIYRDASASVHYLDEQEISMALPVQNFKQALPLAPGFVANHFRGGRAANTLYLIDGMPASGPLTREPAFMVRNSAIAEMVVQTGGFSPEYGNVSAGLVNIITKEGRNDFQGMAKVATDVLSRRERGFENSRNAELAMHGPLTIGLGGPVIEANYLISGGVNWSDTPNGKAIRQAFGSPVLFNYDFNVKLAIHASRHLYLRWQTLLSDYDWRQYDPRWDERLSALPQRKNRNLRTSLSLTHTLNSQTFYKFELAGMELRRNVFGDLPTEAPANLPLENQSVASAWSGAIEPWYEQSVERQLTAHLSLVRQLDQTHQLKAGLEANAWDLSVDRVRYLLWPDGPKKQNNFIYSRYEDAFHEYPFTFAGYLSHKIERKSFLLNLGARYEIFSPGVDRYALPVAGDEALSDSARTSAVNSQQTLAPRLSLAFPISPIEHLSFNWGWFYELPQLYYVYWNPSGKQEARWPLLGNVNLKPLRSRAWEVTYRRVPAPQSVYAITAFYRTYDRLVEAFPLILPGAGKVDTVLRYENRAQTSTTGFELTFKRDFGRGFNGGFVYTNQRSVGNASWPESKLIALARQENDDKQARTPLAWDQRHTFAFNFSYVSRKGILFDALGKFNGPAVTTDWLTGAPIHLPWRQEIDLKLVALVRWDKLRFEPFVEIRNVLDERYANAGEGGLDFSEPLSRFHQHVGRQIWVGIVYR